MVGVNPPAPGGRAGRRTWGVVAAGSRLFARTMPALPAIVPAWGRVATGFRRARAGQRAGGACALVLALVACSTPPAQMPAPSAFAAGQGAAGGPNGAGTQPGAQPDTARPTPLALSLEQDFETVSAQRDIATDAFRIAQARRQRRQIERIDLQRPENLAPNVVAFALATTHPLGQAQHGRNPLFANMRAARNCMAYPNPDAAQRAFLAAGGPERDRWGLDPDGDGYACDWDPGRYRRLLVAR